MLQSCHIGVRKSRGWRHSELLVELANPSDQGFLSWMPRNDRRPTRVSGQGALQGIQSKAAHDVVRDRGMARVAVGREQWTDLLLKEFRPAVGLNRRAGDESQWEGPSNGWCQESPELLHHQNPSRARSPSELCPSAFARPSQHGSESTRRASSYRAITRQPGPAPGPRNCRTI